MAIKTSLSNKLLWVGIVLTLILAVGGAKATPAQTTDQVWSPPLNLSNSGSANSPIILAIPDGPVIALWRDEFDGFVFTRLIDGQWELPKVVDFPFAEADTFPLLFSDRQGSIHAFWLDQEKSLFQSSASVENFGTTNWSGAALVADSVSIFTAIADAQNDLSVLYIRTLNTEDTPTGIYYRKKTNGNAVWSTPILLYQSSYLRLLSPEEIKIELISRTDSEGQSTLYAVWDNRPRSQLLLSISEDAGITWGEVLEIRGPAHAASAPLAVGTTLIQDQLLILWQEKVSETNCRQYYQLVSLTGEPVSAPLDMLSEFPVCPEENQLISTEDGGVILQTSLFNLKYLLAWDGEVWSEPQLQSELSNFINPNTLQPINLQCLHTVAEATNLYMIGCDNDLGGDIWFTSRELNSTSEWFSSPSSWVQPLPFFSTESEISSLALMPDAEGQLHAIWLQSIPGTDGEMEIYNARWDGKTWSYIVSIIQPPLGKANALAAAMDQAGRLFVVWSGGQSGEIYFTWANADLAGTPSEWAPPIVLPMLRPVGATPDILVTDDGLIYVAYAIPLNENRGIYLTTSDDGGNTWSEPIQVVDAAASGWEMVENPLLDITSTNELHLLFWRLPPPDGLEPKALYYARSEDQGNSWSTPEEIVRAELISSWIDSYGQDASYRIWQEIRNEVLVTYLEASPDTGVNWTEPVNFTDFDVNVGVSDVVLDPSGQLHLIQLIEDTNAGVILQESIWDGKSWVKEKREIIDAGGIGDEKWLLEASVTSDGSLGVLITRPINDALSPSSDIIFTSRKLEGATTVTLPATPATEPTSEGTVSPTLNLTPTEIPEATATALPERTPPQTAVDKTILGPIVGLVASGFLVVLAFVIIAKLANRNV